MDIRLFAHKYRVSPENTLQKHRIQIHNPKKWHFVCFAENQKRRMHSNHRRQKFPFKIAPKLKKFYIKTTNDNKLNLGFRLHNPKGHKIKNIILEALLHGEKIENYGSEITPSGIDLVSRFTVSPEAVPWLYQQKKTELLFKVRSNPFIRQIKLFIGSSN